MLNQINHDGVLPFPLYCAPLKLIDTVLCINVRINFNVMTTKVAPWSPSVPFLATVHVNNIGNRAGTLFTTTAIIIVTCTSMPQSNHPALVCRHVSSAEQLTRRHVPAGSGDRHQDQHFGKHHIPDHGGKSHIDPDGNCLS